MDDSMDAGSRLADRRTIIKRAAATGALAWTAPVVPSHSAAAAPTCTPAGKPTVTEQAPTASVSCSKSGGTVTWTLIITGSPD